MSRQSLLARLGLGRPELRAWAMYDWAASAVQTTIMVAVFPIYFVKVAGAGVAGGRRHPAAGDDQLDRAGDHRAGVAGARRHVRLPRRQEAIHRRVHGAGPRRVLRALRRPHRRSRPGLLALRPDHGGRGGQLRVLRGAAPAHRPAGRDRPGLRGRLRDRVSGRRSPAGAQPGVDPDARALRAALRPRAQRERRHPAGAARVPIGGGLVGAVLDPAVPAGAGAAGADRAGRAQGRASGAGGLRPVGRDVSRAPELPAGVPDAAGLPDLQRRHPDHHQDGHGLRDRDRDRADRAHRGDPAGTVRGHPLHLPVRGRGRI